MMKACRTQSPKERIRIENVHWISNVCISLGCFVLDLVGRVRAARCIKTNMAQHDKCLLEDRYALQCVKDKDSGA